MMFWIVACLVVAVFAVLMLSGLRRAGDGLSAGASDPAAYRDQLKEVDRDPAHGAPSVAAAAQAAVAE